MAYSSAITMFFFSNAKNMSGFFNYLNVWTNGSSSFIYKYTNRI